MIARLSLGFSSAFDQEAELTSGRGERGTALPAAPSNDVDSTAKLTHLSGWQLHRSGRCVAHRPAEFANASIAERWLQKFRNDSFAMETMRRVLSAEGRAIALPRMRPEQVIAQVAHLLQSRRWHICVPVIKLYPLQLSKESGQSTLVPRRKPTPSEAPPPPNIQDEPTLAMNADQAGIAAAMQSASQLGIPFCQECTRKASPRATAESVGV